MEVKLVRFIRQLNVIMLFKNPTISMETMSGTYSMQFIEKHYSIKISL